MKAALFEKLRKNFGFPWPLSGHRRAAQRPWETKVFGYIFSKK
jgi:hypothetical protein